MARANFVKRANKDYPQAGIKKGDSYYWWQFRTGPKHYSKGRPKESQLTNSSHKSAAYSIAEEIEMITLEDVKGGLDIGQYTDQIEELRDMAQDSLDNMPDQLRDNSSSGQLLQQRVDDMEDWIQELEGVDLDVDEDSIRTEAEGELPSKEDWDEENRTWEEALEELVEEKLDERAQEILDEIQGISPNIE